MQEDRFVESIFSKKKKKKRRDLNRNFPKGFSIRMVDEKEKWNERRSRRKEEGLNGGGERGRGTHVVRCTPRCHGGFSMRGIHILSAKHRPETGRCSEHRIRRRREGGGGGEQGSDRQGGRLRSEPETDELMLETAGGTCFRASNDLAGATTRRWCWQRR